MKSRIARLSGSDHGCGPAGSRESACQCEFAIAVQVHAVGIVAGVGDEAVGIGQRDHHQRGPRISPRGDTRLAKSRHQRHCSLFIPVQAADDEGDVRRADRSGEVEIRLGHEVAPLDGYADAVLVNFGEQCGSLMKKREG